MPTQPYRIKGRRVPSVTTILGKFKDPGALMYWSWKTAYDVLEEAVEVITNGKGQREFLRSDPLARGNFRDQSAKACEAGTIVHNYVEQWVHADEAERSNLARLTLKEIQVTQSIPKEMAEKILSSFNAFLSWQKTSRLRFWKTETPLVSEKHRFGGTIDCIGKQGPGTHIILDWKTSKSLYADYLLQLAAYAILWDENNPTKPIKSFHLLRFDKEDGAFHHHHWKDLSDAREAFLLMRKLYDLMKQIEKQT